MKYRNFTETLRKLYVSTKFPRQEIRWNFCIYTVEEITRTDKFWSQSIKDKKINLKNNFYTIPSPIIYRVNFVTIKEKIMFWKFNLKNFPIFFNWFKSEKFYNVPCLNIAMLTKV